MKKTPSVETATRPTSSLCRTGASTASSGTPAPTSPRSSTPSRASSRGPPRRGRSRCPTSSSRCRWPTATTWHRRPQAVMVHVTVGTANGSGAIINAARAGPVLFTAGRTPITEDGAWPARPAHPLGAGGLRPGGDAPRVRQVGLRATPPVQLEAVVDRALELRMLAEPRGPCTSRCRARCWPQPLGEP